MKKLLLFLMCISPLISDSAPTGKIEWNKIRHWAGEGDNKAALIVQFSGCDKAYVWGYRWTGATVATGEKMVRDIAAASSDLDVLVQYTGPMGSTVDGIGYSNNHSVLPTLHYDYENAITDGNISFGFMVPNTGMRQTSAPGGEASVLADEAIKNAAVTHIIEHPLNARDYGYAAYDYDYWMSGSTSSDCLWQAGWYKGYWSYWTGDSDLATLGYSGLGMTSVELADGDVHAWAYMSLDGDVDATSGATPGWGSLDYDHFLSPASVTEIVAPDSNMPVTVYNGSGAVVGVLDKVQLKNLVPGFYIVRQGGKSYKVVVK